MTSTRIVVTGLGVISANANNCMDFREALFTGRSGLRHLSRLAELGFGCQVGGIPQGIQELAAAKLSEEMRYAMNEPITYATLAALEAFADAGLEAKPLDSDEIFEDTGAIIGSGIGGIDTFSEKVYPALASGRIRRLGSTVVEQIMVSGAAARIAGILGLGNQVFSNSSACNTGAESIFLGMQRIRSGLAKRMLVGGTEGSDPHIWAGFDAMRVLNRKHNHLPEQASRSLSASAEGFIPSAGAGVIILESLDSAQKRGAKIYAELLGAAVNSGGMRGGGSMTAPGPRGVQRCIREAMLDAKISPQELDYINGHLTATMADPLEIKNWAAALERSAGNFPLINATKSMIGHALGAAGAIETVATLLQLHHGFVHGSLNCQDFHPEIADFAEHVPQASCHIPLSIAAKASFGFGDVNSCIIFRKWSS